MLMLSSSRRTSLPILYYCCASSIASRAAAFSRNMVSSSFSTSLSSSPSASSKSNSSSILDKPQVSVLDAISVHDETDVKFIDGTWWLDKARNGRHEFDTGPRISEARYLDIDEISTKTTSTTTDNLPHMMPQASLQSAAMETMGIRTTDHVIVYGRQDCMFVTRAYMQMRTMGHPKELCHLLDGSLEEWIDAGGPTEKEGSSPSYPPLGASSVVENKPEGSTTSTTTSYQATDPQNIVSIDELRAWIDEGKTMGENPDVLVVDARSKGRFTGDAPEPRPGLRGGHMPGAINLPIIDLLDPSNTVRFKPRDELKKILEDSGIPLPLGKDDNKVIVSTCGSGVTACAMLTALDILDEDSSNVFLFDGAWVQWGGQPDTPIVKD